VLKLCRNTKFLYQNGLCFERKQVPRIDIRPCKTWVWMYGMKRSALPYKQEVDRVSMIGSLFRRLPANISYFDSQ
jgi:hypothetical protein